MEKTQLKKGILKNSLFPLHRTNSVLKTQVGNRLLLLMMEQNIHHNLLDVYRIYNKSQVSECNSYQIKVIIMQIIIQGLSTGERRGKKEEGVDTQVSLLKFLIISYEAK